MIDPLGIHALSLSDSRAEIEVVGAEACANGELYGPLCAYARTLPTQFPFLVGGPQSEGESSVRVVVADPCYWTPALPFLYDFVLRHGHADSAYREVRRKIGFRRLFPMGLAKRRSSAGEAFTLESRRFVFRGVRVAALERYHLDQAHREEAALLVDNPRLETCATASDEGVFLIADLRRAGANVQRELAHLAWFPSVALVILDADAISLQVQEAKRRGLRVAQAVDSAAEKSAVKELADSIVFELCIGERPPTWAASYEKPVIAIRPGQAYADLREARSACDRLQADLAPEFDLAGYFV